MKPARRKALDRATGGQKWVRGDNRKKKNDKYSMARATVSQARFVIFHRHLHFFFRRENARIELAPLIPRSFAHLARRRKMQLSSRPNGVDRFVDECARYTIFFHICIRGRARTRCLVSRFARFSNRLCRQNGNRLVVKARNISNFSLRDRNRRECFHILISRYKKR